MMLTIGKISFLKFQGWIIIIVFIFKPKLKRTLYLGKKNTLSSGLLKQRNFLSTNHFKPLLNINNF